MSVIMISCSLTGTVHLWTPSDLRCDLERTDVFRSAAVVVENEVKELLDIAREYITAIRLKLAMADVSDPVRMTELWAYFTHCNLQPIHQVRRNRSSLL